jgi:TRAP transporter 4TM/12TM fusion protein
MPPWARGAVLSLALALALWGLYSAVGTVPAHTLRIAHVGLLLALSFLLHPALRSRPRLSALDVVLAFAGLVCAGYVLWDFDAFVYRSAAPSPLDLVFGVLTVVLVLEAARRTAGAMLPALAALALVYAVGGGVLPAPFSHRGYGLARLVGLEYMGLEGLLGTPVAVSATFIILFTLYGAILERTGAGAFFVELSLAAVGRRRAGPGRAVTLASFLLGGPSGSGVATAVTLGAVTWPLLRKAGYTAERAGALLAAGGIGAVLSPPVMGAASFLIAELTRVGYLQVIRWALVPTLLYYLAVLVMIEHDAAGLREPPLPVASRGVWALLRGHWFHLVSLVAIVVLLLMGWSAERAVVWCMVLAVALSWLRRETAIGPAALVAALEKGARAVVPVGATCAAAGILVGVVNLTGLGLKFSGIVVDLAGGALWPTVLMTAAVLLVLGLALPITASYIVAAVIAAPALTAVGVSEPGAHMLIFYYAVLSEVSPPTALSCVAVSAITGGNAYKTMWVAWRYTLPAFLVPLLFAAPGGTELLLVGPGPRVALGVGTALAGVVALAAGIAGGFRAPWPAWLRALVAGAGLLLMYPDVRADLAALCALAGALGGRVAARPVAKRS